MISFKQNVSKVFQLILPYWRSEDKWRAWGLLILTLFLNVALVYVTVQANEWYVKFYNALQELNKPLFIAMCVKFFWLVSILISVFALNNYTTSLLSFRWRKWLTEKYVHRWTRNSTHYRLKVNGVVTDNPDQRISQDLNTFSQTMLSLFISLFKETLSLGSFIVILWGISGPLVISLYKGNSITIPGYMVWAALLYCILGTGLLFKIGKKLIPLNYDKEKYEANFRYNLIRLREHSEEVAIYKSATVEEATFKGSFRDIATNFGKIIKQFVYINCFQNFYDRFAMIIPFIIAAPQFFSGAIALGVLMQIANAFSHVQSSLSILVDNFQQIAGLVATTQRILGFTEALESEEQASLTKNLNGVIILQSANNALKIDNLSLTTPNGKPLLENLKLTVSAGEKLLIMGPNGSGKSTLLRALSGFWPYGQGTLYLPKNPLFMVPQKPYLPIDTLRNCLVYPGITRTVTPSEILTVLQKCQLGHLEAYLDESKDWRTVLSLGEQQRIIFVRILLHKPDWIILDEPTASIDKETESLLYQTLIQYLPNATIITIGHSHTLKAFHSSVIEINALKEEVLNADALGVLS